MFHFFFSLFVDVPLLRAVSSFFPLLDLYTVREKKETTNKIIIIIIKTDEIKFDIRPKVSRMNLWIYIF